MDNNEFKNNWKQIRGHAQQWWGKLTDDDLERVDGKLEQLFGVLQERYGYTRVVAEETFNQRMAQSEARQKQKRDNYYGGQSPLQDIGASQWEQMHSHAREWWGKLTDEDLEKAAGKTAAVFALLQAEYGFSRDRAEAEFRRRVGEYVASQQEHPVPITLFTMRRLNG